MASTLMALLFAIPLLFNCSCSNDSNNKIVAWRTIDHSSSRASFVRLSAPDVAAYAFSSNPGRLAFRRGQYKEPGKQKCVLYRSYAAPFPKYSISLLHTEISIFL